VTVVVSPTPDHRVEHCYQGTVTTFRVSARVG
jgi:hypothetical protein